MRQVISYDSVKAIYIDREKVLKELKKIAKEALKEFPEIKEIILFGSVAKGEETGLSDLDIFIIAEDQPSDPIERIRPYFNYFAERLKIGIDIIVATPEEKENFKEILRGSLLIS